MTALPTVFEGHPQKMRDLSEAAKPRITRMARL
jgi:hypothetical protein